MHHAEAIGDKSRIGQRCIGGRIGAGRVEIAECGRLVDEYAAGQVDRQRDAGLLRRIGHLIQHRRLVGIHRQRQCAVFGRALLRQRDTVRGIVGGDRK